MRINKFIAENSKYSRRKADQLIIEGKVFINNQKLQNPGTTINPKKDEVKVNGKPIIINKEKIYIALNKPQGFISTRKDEFNRHTVMELLPKIQNLKPIGRLDKDTEGLLLFSNDGNFINHLTHPRYECEKEYLVKITGEIDLENIKKLEDGVKIDKKKTAKARIKIIKKTNSQTVLKIVIHEGRNRQIRKMFASINHPVKYLQRIRIGKIKLHSLKIGHFKKLTKQEIDDI